MRLMQVILKESLCRMKALEKRSFTTIISCVTVVAVVSMLFSGFSGDSKGKVYAVYASDMRGGEKETVAAGGLQTGVMGIANSIESIEKYSKAVSSVNITTENE